jgi:hypothetical protein
MLFWRDLIGFHPWENLAFAAFILLPVESTHWRKAKNMCIVLLAATLLYYDSWLPAIGRVLSQASQLSNFSLNYLIELIGRFISLPTVAMLVIAWVVYWRVAGCGWVDGRCRNGGDGGSSDPARPSVAHADQPDQQAGNIAADTKPDRTSYCNPFTPRKRYAQFHFRPPRPAQSRLT